ncbi:MAG: GAF domain-containing protein [Myxococcales bacterium]|nr:GAF domain-containing protein [Myxococcales bacterium]
MFCPAFPKDEVERLASLHGLNILDTPPELVFDRLTRIAAHVFGTPISALSLVDGSRQWFKSSVGLTIRQTSRDISFCGHAILGDDILHVTDTLDDDRFFDNPLVVGQPGIRFYAGIPINAENGHAIGVLCVMDIKPRALSEAERVLLRDLATMAEDELARRGQTERQLRLYALAESLGAHKRLSNAISEAQSLFLARPSRKEAFEVTLLRLLELTDSAYGFIGEILKRSDGTPYLKSYAITDISWSDEIREYVAKGSPAGLEFTNLKTLFGAAITTGQPVIANSAPTDPRRGGIPEGHPPLNTFLGLPIHHGGQLVAMVGLANRQPGYDEEVVSFLDPLLATIGQLVVSYRTQRALMESEELFRSLTEHAPVGIIMTDLSGHVSFLNGPMTRLAGLDAASVIGKSWDMLVHEQDRATLQGEFEKNAHVSKPFDIDVRLATADMPWVTVQIVQRRNELGAVTGCLSTVMDITARKRMEAELRASRDAAQAASRAKSEFLANMSHEIRTPMNAVVGLATLLTDTSLDPQQLELTRSISSSAEALLCVINDVLDFSRIESGLLVLEIRPFHLGQLVQDTASAVRATAAAKRLDLDVKVDPRCERGVLGDPGRLRQVLTNLLGNAVKFTETGGVYLDVRMTREGPGVPTIRLTVRDTGIGIEAASIWRLFDRFVQADSSTTRRYGGTGLGLAITKQLVTLMDGTVGVVSEPGDGSTFWVDVPLPWADAEPPKVEDPPARTAPLGPLVGRVLVVEDNILNQRVARGMLERLGLHIDVAENGAVALAKLGKERYDVVLMDCQMPVMDGFEATGAIRRGDLGVLDPTVPIIAMTANALADEVEHCLEAGMNLHIAKPVNPAAFHRALSVYLPETPRPE